MKTEKTTVQKIPEDNPYLKMEVMASEHRLEKQISTLELKMEQRFNHVEQRLEQRFSELSVRMNQGFSDIYKHMATNTRLLIAVFGLIIGALITYLEWKFK